jgi:hypothetical protein
MTGGAEMPLGEDAPFARASAAGVVVGIRSPAR